MLTTRGCGGRWLTSAGTALGIPEQYGGVGSFLDWSYPREAGRALLPGPSLRHGPGGAGSHEAATEARRRKSSAPSAEGRARATLALPNVGPLGRLRG